jgi:predicted Rossmann fold flavoprotein
LLDRAGLEVQLQWAQLPKDKINRLVELLTQCDFEVTGKGQFKDEFVTCGGVRLKDVNFTTMESRVCPGLFLAGEILDVDGVTGGFNFQNAWTTGWIAGQAMAQPLPS